tara:strand:- start:3926 stop:5149 length:1224 start_codon:yes stop_codon:yes gene_type:complete
MAFKMNKPSMVQGTKRYRDAIKAIKLNREASSNKTKEGRAESSAFQMAEKSSMRSYAEAKKRDPKLDEHIKARNAAEKGSPEYNAAQNRINKAYGKGPTDRKTTKMTSETGKGGKTIETTTDAAKPGVVKTNVKDEARGVEKRTMTKDDGSERKVKIKGRNRRTERADESKGPREKGTKTKITDRDAEGNVVRKEKIRKDKEGKVKGIKVKTKDAVTGNVTKTKIDSEGKKTSKTRKGFKGSEVGKFLTAKAEARKARRAAKKEEKSSMTKPDRRTMEKIEDSSMTKPKSSTKRTRNPNEDPTGIKSSMPKPNSSMPKPKSSMTAAEKSSMRAATKSSMMAAEKTPMTSPGKTKKKKKAKSSMRAAEKSSMTAAEKSSMEFNKELKAAAKAGKLDKNPKFKAAVMRG